MGHLLVAGFLRWIGSCRHLDADDGPGTVPPKVQTLWTKPSATVISFSSITRSMSCVVPSSRSGATGSCSV